MDKRRSNRRASLWAAFALGVSPWSVHGDGPAHGFGFTGPELFPIDAYIANLRGADLDGDGLMDLIVVNNLRSKINLLYNQTGKTNATEPPERGGKRELNELPPGSRFKIESIASEKRISSLVVTDLNGDGRPDLAYYGEPKALLVLYNEGNKVWSAAKQWPISEGQININGLVDGDLNGDGLDDLALLGEREVFWLPQKSDHSLGEPERIPFSGVVKGVQILDLDGDGRQDLLMVNWDTPNPLRIRFQRASGGLGPEIHFTLPPIRSYLAEDLDNDKRAELLTIAQNSGRAQISSFERSPAESLSEAWLAGQFQVLPLTKTTKSRRGIEWADVDDDGWTDLLVSEPDSGQMTVCFQRECGEWSAPKTFPTFSGVTDLAVADWDQDGHADIFLLSADERQIGVTQLDENRRIPFPRTLPLQGRPLVLAAGCVQATNSPALAAVLEQDGRRVLQVWSADGQTTTQQLSDTYKSNPASLTIHDVDQDGLPDLVLLTPYEKIKILRQVADAPFDEQEVAPPGGGGEQPWMSRFDVDGDGKPELMLAQKNFVRAVVLQRDPGRGEGEAHPIWSFAVKEQINGAAANSRIVGAAGLRNGGETVASLFLLDAERKMLTLCERDAGGVWQIVRNLELPMTDFTALQPLALGSAKANCVAFVGLNTVAWMPLAGEVWKLAELDGYETPIKDGYLLDVVSGDLSQDGRKDLVFLETGKHYVDLVAYQPPHALVPGNRWQVFEERTFRGQRAQTPEPREALVADLTGDGKQDLAILVHDRVLVYPQE